MKRNIILLIALILLLSCEKKQSKNIDVYENVNSEEKNRNALQEVKPIEVQKKEMYPQWDDSAYDDKVTIEFSLFTEEKQNFCLYHNIRKIEGINLDSYTEINSWCKKNIDDLTVVWNYKNGAILSLETESNKYTTKRGIRVGVPLSMVMDLYEQDSDVFSWNYDNNSFDEIDLKEDGLFSLYSSEEGISIDAANFIDEEIMTLIFYATDGVITKIEIKCGS